MTQDERRAQLDRYADCLAGITERPGPPCLPSSDFDPKSGFADTRRRFAVAWRLRDGRSPPPELIEAEHAAAAEWRAQGSVVSEWISPDRTRGGMQLRGESAALVHAALATLPLAGFLDFEVAEVDLGAQPIPGA